MSKNYLTDQSNKALGAITEIKILIVLFIAKAKLIILECYTAKNVC